MSKIRPTGLAEGIDRLLATDGLIAQDSDDDEEDEQEEDEDSEDESDGYSE